MHGLYLYCPRHIQTILRPARDLGSFVATPPNMALSRFLHMPALQVFLSCLDPCVILDRRRSSSSDSRPRGLSASDHFPKAHQVRSSGGSGTPRVTSIEPALTGGLFTAPLAHPVYTSECQRLVRRVPHIQKRPGASPYAKPNQRIHRQQEGNFCINRTPTGWVCLRHNQPDLFTLSTSRLPSKGAAYFCTPL